MAAHEFARNSTQQSLSGSAAGAQRKFTDHALAPTRESLMAWFKSVGHEDSQEQYDEWEEGGWSTIPAASEQNIAFFSTLDDKMKALRKCSEADWETAFGNPTNMIALCFRVVTGSDILSYCRESVKTMGSPFYGYGKSGSKATLFGDAFLEGLCNTAGTLFKDRSDTILSQLVLNLLELQTCVFKEEEILVETLPKLRDLKKRPICAALVKAIEYCNDKWRKYRSSQELVDFLRGCYEPSDARNTITKLSDDNLDHWWLAGDWK